MTHIILGRSNDTYNFEFGLLALTCKNSSQNLLAKATKFSDLGTSLVNV